MTTLKSRTRWRTKLEKDQEAKIVDIPPRMQKRFGPGRMLIARPIDVDSLIRQVRKGRLVTQSTIREKLARDYRADVAYPMTTGIFVRIVAETAEEDLREGKKTVTPYWRVLRDDGSLNEKSPGGVHRQASLLGEGHSVEAPRGKKRPRVRGFEKCLVSL